MGQHSHANSRGQGITLTLKAKDSNPSQPE